MISRGSQLPMTERRWNGLMSGLTGTKTAPDREVP